MLNMLEELLEENAKIPADVTLLREFKELHKKIAYFDLEKLIERIEKTKEQPVEKRPSDSEKTTENIDYAESLIQQYNEFGNQKVGDQKYPLQMPKATIKAENLKRVVEHYTAELPRLIKENYERFVCYSKKLRKARLPSEYSAVKGLKTRFAREFKNYFESGKRYEISALWRGDVKLKEVNDYLGEAEVERIKKENRDRKPSAKEKLQNGMLVRKVEITRMELERAKLNYKTEQEKRRRKGFEKMEKEKRTKYFEELLKTNLDKDERYRLYIQAVDQNTIDKGSVDGSSYFGISYNLDRLGKNDKYRELKDILNADKKADVDDLVKLNSKIKEMTAAKDFAEDKRDLDYIEGFYCCVREPLRRGEFLRLRTPENEKVITGLLDNFEKYIAKSKKHLITQGSAQYSKAG